MLEMKSSLNILWFSATCPSTVLDFWIMPEAPPENINSESGEKSIFQDSHPLQSMSMLSLTLYESLSPTISDSSKILITFSKVLEAISDYLAVFFAFNVDCSETGFHLCHSVESWVQDKNVVIDASNDQTVACALNACYSGGYWFFLTENFHLRSIF